jgi:MoxR-like ATPase
LPHAQPDRFLLNLSIWFPPPEEEDRILRLYQGRATLGPPLEVLGPAPDADGPNGRVGLSRAQLLQARDATAGVAAKAEVCAYVGRIVRTTREMDRVVMGACFRAAVHLLQAAKVRALMSRRNIVSPDDDKRVCRPVLRHRLTLQPDAYVEGFTTDGMLTTVLERVEVPR